MLNRIDKKVVNVRERNSIQFVAAAVCALAERIFVLAMV
jgi:hypothetical protein